MVQDEQRSLDWLEEHEPGVVAARAAALNNERDLIEAVVQHASAEVAMQILFAKADPETATELAKTFTPVIDWGAIRTQYGDEEMSNIHSTIQTAGKVTLIPREQDEPCRGFLDEDECVQCCWSRWRGEDPEIAEGKMNKCIDACYETTIRLM